MRRVKRLKTLARKIDRRIKRFERRLDLLIDGQADKGMALDAHQIEAEMSILVINIQSYWANWCRSFYFSAAMGTKASFHPQVVSNIQNLTEHSALTLAIVGHLNKPAPDPWPSHREPKWFSPPDLATMIGNCQINEAATLTPILNAAPSGFSHLRTMRNYYAHRSAGLLKEALALGPTYLIGTAKRPSEILMFIETGRTVTVLHRWLIDLRRTALALC